MRHLCVGLLLGLALAACRTPTPSSPLITEAAASSVASASPEPTTAFQIVQTHGRIDYASWSPDARWLLVRSGDPSELSLFDASGALLRVLDADAADWLAANDLVLWGHGNARSETVDGAETVPLPKPPPVESLANGHGAFAYPITKAGPNARFVVWISQGTAGPRPGVPIGWSSDGSRLAVWHPTEPVTGPWAIGSLEILDWPSLRTVATAGDHIAGRVPAPIFDSSGRYVAFFSGSPSILDLMTEAVVVTGADTASDTLAWDGDGNLRYVSADSEVVAVSVSGDRIGDAIPGEAVVSAANGALTVVYTPQDGPTAAIELIGEAGARSVVLSGPIEPNVAVAPDGSAVAIICAAGNQLVLVTR